MQQDEDPLVGLEQQIELQISTKGEVKESGGVGINGQQQGFIFRQNKETPQNKTQDLQVKKDPQVHMKNTLFHLI